MRLVAPFKRVTASIRHSPTRSKRVSAARAMNRHAAHAELSEGRRAASSDAHAKQLVMAAIAAGADDMLAIVRCSQRYEVSRPSDHSCTRSMRNRPGSRS
jgi:hypothetical protein